MRGDLQGSLRLGNKAQKIHSILKQQLLVSKAINYFLFPKIYNVIYSNLFLSSGPGSSVDIATELQGWKVRDRFPVGTRFSALQTGPGAHPASCKIGTASFPGVKSGRGVLLTTHRLLVPRSWKSRSIPLPTFWAKPGL